MEREGEGKKKKKEAIESAKERRRGCMLSGGRTGEEMWVWEIWLVVLTGLMGCWRQGKEWGHTWASALGNWIRWLAFIQVRKCKMVVGLWGKMMNLILDMSCGHTGNPLTYGMFPSWTPCNGFHTLFSTWAKYIRTKIKVLCVFTLSVSFYKSCL